MYSVYYAQETRHDQDDDDPPKTVGHMKQEETGKRNLHAEKDFSQNLETLNLDACLRTLFKKYQEVF